MTINREKLIKLLVEKTDLAQAEVETQLDELTNRILNAANRGKALEIKDFGLFYFDEEGQLSFKAADQLDKEINYQYAGMEPVELKPAKRKSPSAEKDTSEEPESGTVEDEDEDTTSTPVIKDDVFGIGRTLSGEKEKKEVEDEEDEKDDTSEAADPFEKLFQDPEAEIKPQKEETIYKAGTAVKKKSTVKNPPASSDKKKSRDPMTMIIVIILGFVVLSVGYLMLSEYLEAPEPAPQELTEEPAPIEEPPVTADPDVTEAEEPAEQEEVRDGEQVVTGEQDTPAEDESYGLYGNFVEASGIEYTIVVYSLPTLEHAEQAAEELRQEDFRTIVMERMVNDRVVFRVGLGQFETIQSAVSEAESLPEPYRNQNFIHRIQ